MPTKVKYQSNNGLNITQMFLRAFSPSLIGRGPERAAFLALTGSVVLVIVSIAASGILLAAATIAFCWVWKQNSSSSFRLPAFALPLFIFFLWTVVTAIASPDVQLNLVALKKFFIFFVLFFVPWIVRRPKTMTWIYHAVFTVTTVSALKGIAQFIANPNRDVMHRITGFMSHWMTFSGLLMLALVALLAYALCFKRVGHPWAIILGLLFAVVLVLSETRNTCLGAIAGMVVVCLLMRPRAIFLLLAIVVGLYFLSPSNIKQRFSSGFNLNDTNTRNRVELFQTSLRVIKNNVWLGTGQKGVQKVALKYRGTYEFPDWLYQHMHNNFLQIAAERGIPGLVLWLWFMGRLAWDALLVYRSARKIPRGPDNEALLVSTAALGAWTALLISGIFEYNFGDAEVLTLFLFFMSGPYAFIARTPLPSSAQQESAVLA